MGSGSPRATVAFHLRTLALDAGAEPGGGGGGGASPGQPLHLHHEGSRGSDGGDVDMRVGEAPDAGIGSRLRRRNKTGAGPAGSVAQDIATADAADMEDAALDTKTKAAGKKRAKAPAATRAKRTTKKPKKKQPEEPPPEEDGTPPREIVDPLRASLTWQEDEITVYDPEDSDDDGEGMDGVGFQSPPGAARATARKKMRQLAEYRRMVEREAREGRRRRRGRAGDAERVTRVRFLGRDTVISAV